MGWAIHLHLVAAIAWIGGAFFMFLLGVSLRKKEDQDAVYPRIGPIYGYFETAALIILLITGYTMIANNGLLDILFSNLSNEVIDALRIKLNIVAVIVVLTVIHMTISMLTLHKVKTPLQRLLSKGSSMGIFLLNLIVLHYAMVLRDIL
ncbi:MAG: hypothetical protein KC427_00415 [Sulfurovum sp.]|uniref:hypothetical protein n=1 Tax=Sulfurovum sp. TaxID=1969726 RepID=UPI0028682E9A|nr:hypothetical protein [Sulfurovum sp.]MCO4844459.1 hypothetical protein [Sulfurovum sp.]